MFERIEEAGLLFDPAGNLLGEEETEGHCSRACYAADAQRVQEDLAARETWDAIMALSLL
jgi:hypothetical protein